METNKEILAPIIFYEDGRKEIIGVCSARSTDHQAASVYGKGLGSKNRNFLVNTTARYNDLVKNMQNTAFVKYENLR